MTKPAVIELEHFYFHSPAAVWKALTTPDLLAKWWAPNEIKPLVGHQFHLDMGHFGKQSCEVLRVEENKLLQIRFGSTSINTTITWQLIEEKGGTRLRLTHEGFNLDTPMGRQALEGMRNGWPRVMERLAGVL